MRKKKSETRKRINRKNTLRVWRETCFDYCPVPAGKLVPVVREYRSVVGE